MTPSGLFGGLESVLALGGTKASRGLRSDSSIDFLGGARARKEIEVKDERKALAASGGRLKGDP